jgi:excisionase family DNA binding protein
VKMKSSGATAKDKQDLLNAVFTEPLLTVEDVANYLRLKQETVRMMARTRKIPALKVGKVWRFRASDIKSVLQTSKK